MATYIPEHAAFSCGLCLASTRPWFQIPRGVGTQTPPIPCMTTIPLPLEPNLSTETTVEQSRDTTLDTYPLKIASHLPLGQQLKLRGVKLITPVHVHSPLAHIGTIASVPHGQIITALDAVLILQSIITVPLDFQTAYSQLSTDMKDRVRREFLQRTGTTEPRTCESIWARFVSEILERHGPLGVDLLLGNSEVWGLEACSVGGYSVVHVANVGFV